MKKLFTVIFISSLIFFLRPEFVQAACPLPAGGNITFSNGDTCTISGVVGVDSTTTDISTTNSASITLPTGSSITINNGGILVGSTFAFTGGTAAVQTGGQMMIGGILYVTDSDADGWADNFTLYTATASGRRRLSLMKSLTAVDCNPVSYKADNICCFSGGTACTADADCCSPNVCGTDADADLYFSSALGHTGTCQTSHPYTDANDASRCADADTPSTGGSAINGLTCKKCVNGTAAIQTSSEDLFSQCTAGNCATGNCNGTTAACQSSGTWGCNTCCTCCDVAHLGSYTCTCCGGCNGSGCSCSVSCGSAGRYNGSGCYCNYVATVDSCCSSCNCSCR